MQFEKLAMPTQPIQLAEEIDTNVNQSCLSSHFDDRLEQVMDICSQLMRSKGVYHLSIHFCSSQLVCWTYDNPYSFQIYSAEEVFADNFMRLFAPLESHLHTCIARDQVDSLLRSIKFLRQRNFGSELRNASIHMMNGYIGLGFACDDTRYINFRNFAPTLDKISS